MMETELHEIIAKIHEDIEGRYELDSYDKTIIHNYLCDLQTGYSEVDRRCLELLKFIRDSDIEAQDDVWYDWFTQSHHSDFDLLLKFKGEQK